MANKTTEGPPIRGQRAASKTDNLHEQDNNTAPSNALAAREYAKMGLPVFPVHGLAAGRCTCGRSDCDTPGKHPMTSHGFKDATADLHQIDQWWGQVARGKYWHADGASVRPACRRH